LLTLVERRIEFLPIIAKPLDKILEFAVYLLDILCCGRARGRRVDGLANVDDGAAELCG
jgi:hypothetical protein